METRKLAVIMFTDMVGYSKKVHADEGQALRLLSRHNEILQGQIDAYQGRVIKTIGDAFFADFASVFSAVNCAMDIQRQLAAENAGVEDEERMDVRIGIHVGDVIYREDDIFGDGVNIASRIEAEAGAGQIFISSDVFSITFGKLQCQYNDIGNRSLKNIDRPMHLYEVLWDPSRASEAMEEVPIIARESAGFAAQEKTGKGKALALVLVLVVFAVVGALLLLRGRETQENAVVGKPALVVLAFADETGDERLARVQIGRIVSDAVEQKFYEYPYARLISPLNVSRSKKELGVGDADIAADPDLATDIARSVEGRFVLMGSLSKLGAQYILSAELNDLESGQLLSKVRLTEESEDRIVGSLTDTLCARLQTRLSRHLGVRDNHEILSVGKLTTPSLEAYGHFVRGFELYQSGYLNEGVEQLIAATRIDSEFAMAYSVAACALSFAQEDSLSMVYQNKAFEFADRFKGNSKEALIFRGNAGWFADDKARCEKNYRLFTELYPDDREGFHYYGLYFHYLQNDFPRAIELYDWAIALTPDYFPIYRDKAYALKELAGEDAAVLLLQGYLRAYGDGPGAGSARDAIAEIRGAKIQ